MSINEDVPAKPVGEYKGGRIHHVGQPSLPLGGTTEQRKKEREATKQKASDRNLQKMWLMAQGYSTNDLSDVEKA